LRSDALLRAKIAQVCPQALAMQDVQAPSSDVQWSAAIWCRIGQDPQRKAAHVFET
jgi:hypothetical protein